MHTLIHDVDFKRHSWCHKCGKECPIWDLNHYFIQLGGMVIAFAGTCCYDFSAFNNAAKQRGDRPFFFD